MGRQHFNDPLKWVKSDGTAVANTTTETILFPDVTIPAEFMHDGRCLRVRAFGKLSTTGTPTFKVGLRWGGAVSGVLLAETEAITMGSGVTNVNWSVEALIQSRSDGSSGTLLAMGDFSIHSSATAILANVFGISGFDAPAVATCDLTVAKALSLVATWGTANASNTATGLIEVIEAMN